MPVLEAIEIELAILPGEFSRGIDRDLPLSNYQQENHCKPLPTKFHSHANI